MGDLVRVTVAPGAHITITPHPAGLAVLGPLVLFGGNTATVSAERAAALYAAGLVLHPVTGELPPTPEAMGDAAVAMVSHDNGPFQRLDGSVNVHPNWGTAATAPVAPEPQLPATNHMHGVLPRSSVTYGAGPSGDMATITAADGQSWPNF